jgi:sugar lactone lactonase YvrE
MLKEHGYWLKTNLIKTRLKSSHRTAHHLFSPVVCFGAVLLISTKTQAQNLFVTGINDVYEITPGGVPSTFADLVYPSGLAFDSAGDLFVSSGDARPVLGDITPSGTAGSFSSGLLFWPVMPAINGAGDLFVAVGGGRSYGGSGSGTIYEFTPGGAQSTFASGLSNVPYGGLAFNSAGDLFSADGGSIYEYTPDGVRSTFASGLNEPLGLAFNNAGDLFVAENGSGNIYEFTPDGVQSTFASGLDAPVGLAFDGAGDLFAADAPSGTIYEYTPDGVRSIFASGLIEPQYIAIQGVILPVPEPSVLGLLALGTIALLVRRRRNLPRCPVIYVRTVRDEDSGIF